MSSTVLAEVLVFYLLFFSDITSRKLRLPGVGAADDIKTAKLNECGRCKVLTDSFNYWLKKTARGKYEGGDAAWEEAKLKSYARSEIRFVEVQEGLCSDLSRHEHDCYMFAEEAEQALETWWFHEDPTTVDLHTWLCIETLKLCCPNNHYGDSCAPCPLDTENKICSGHGKCDGDGTRKGNGSCICNRGYVGTYCEECSKNYYNNDDSCKQCDRACEGCTRAGPAACKACKNGWHLDSGICTDINECLLSSICKPNQYCINKEGSYSCKSCDASCISCVGAGPLNCTSCEPDNYILWNGKCISDSLKTEIIESAVSRMIIYMGIFMIPGVLYSVNRYLALLVFVIFSIYIYYTEKSIGNHVSTYEVFFKFLWRPKWLNF